MTDVKGIIHTARYMTIVLIDLIGESLFILFIIKFFCEQNFSIN
jgi:hypothetical protein